MRGDGVRPARVRRLRHDVDRIVAQYELVYRGHPSPGATERVDDDASADGFPLVSVIVPV
jgi:hypothetical protein